VSGYKATVLSSFQDVADTLASLEHDAQALAETDSAAQAAHQIFVETTAQCQLGALPLTIERTSEQQYLSAELDAARARGQRLADTASLFQAMGQSPESERPPHRTNG
jgi:outer membrane protein TolC